jgi:Ca2+:H+ antiporter
LIITIVAIREGLLELVKASITGSILGNLLLVLGMGMLAGGTRHGTQTFDRRKTSSDSILLVLAVTALGVPSLFSHFAGGITDNGSVEALSLGVSAMMIAIYALGLLYGMRLEPNPLARDSAEAVAGEPGWGMRTAIVVLIGATLGTVWMSEILVGQVEPVVRQLGVSEFFLGIILVPIVGNVAEHLVAVRVAMKNKMSLCAEISIGSSIQVALLVAPLLVFISLVLGNSLTLVFNNFELVALIGAAVITAFVASDGESNWLEGASLLTLYLILGLAFFLLPQ